NYQAMSVVNGLGTNEFSPDDLWPGWQWTLRGLFSHRHDAIVATLQRYGNPPFTVTAPVSTSSPRVTLSGTAPIEVKTIRINGAEPTVAWTMATAWQLALVLTNGTNVLCIQGVDRFGHTLPSARVTNLVTCTNP